MVKIVFSDKIGLFNYEEFFNTQIDKKKKDHSYRVFKVTLTILL